MINQLALPYEVITEVAPRSTLRANFIASSLVAYKIPFNDILIRDGWNRREVYEEIEELAESIFEKGLLTPFVLVVLPDKRCFIKRGHRRHRAISLLVEQGRWKADTLVEFFPTKSTETEYDMMADQLLSNFYQKPFTVLEEAHVVHDLKYNYNDEPVSNDELGKVLGGMSRQRVDNLIKIWEQSDEVKATIKSKNLGMSDILNYIRTLKRAAKQDEKQEDAAHLTSLNVRYVEPFSPIPKEDTDEENGEQADRKEREKKPFDEGRAEIALCQNVIKNVDWLSVQSEKLPQQVSADFVSHCNWIQKDMEELRAWVHANKKNNKKDF